MIAMQVGTVERSHGLCTLLDCVCSVGVKQKCDSATVVYVELEMTFRLSVHIGPLYIV